MLKSALFVDFDNIYLGLKNLDPKPAVLFATNPIQWLSWMEHGMRKGDETAASTEERSFLVRRCYLDSGRLDDDRYRRGFSRAGFTIIDCPQVTSTGKNSADIYMVVDLLEHLEHKTVFDEFVILSGDSDFIPALIRLRARDRRTTILSIQHAVEAYKAAADNVVSASDFIQYGLKTSVRPQSKAPRPSTQARPSAPARPQPGTVLVAQPPPASPLVSATEADLRSSSSATADTPLDELVVNAVLQMVKSSPIPVKLADAGSRIRRTFGTARINESRWAGGGTLKKLLKSRHIEAMGIQMDNIHLYDSTRHRMPPSPEPSGPRPVDVVPATAESDQALVQELPSSDDASAVATLLESDDIPLADPDIAPPMPEFATMPEQLARFALQINVFTGAPVLSTDQYTRVFANIERYLMDNDFNFTLAVKQVHNLCMADDPDISEASISSIIETMMTAGHQFAGTDTAVDLASAFLQNVATLYRDAQQELSEDEEALLDEWILGGRADEAIQTMA